MSGKPRKDGGPAFPFEKVTVRRGGDVSEWENHNGMSLRDYFAARALEALIVGRKWDEKVFPDDRDLIEAWANGSYAIADAMLRARDAAQ